MPLINYTYQRDTHRANIIADLDVEIECSVDVGDDPYVTVHAVYFDAIDRDGHRVRVDLMDTDDLLMKALGRDIADTAENDDWFIEKATEEAGLYWTGRGVNDPSGEWRAA